MSEEPELRTLRRNVRELPGAAWVLVGGSFINRFASFAAVFLVLYLTRRGFSVAAAGAAVALYGAGEMTAAVAGGVLADRIGRRNTIALSMFSNAVALVVLSQLEAYPAIVVTAFFAGLAAELYRPAAAALVADVVPEGQRVTAFAVLRLAINLAFAAGGAVAGFLADRSFLWLFLTDAATSVVFGAVALLALPDGNRIRRADDAGGGVRAIVADRGFLLFLGAAVLVAFVYFQSYATLPLHVTREAGLDESDFGLLLALNGLIIVLLELPISSVTMRLPARRMMAVGFVFTGIGFGLTSIAYSMPLLAMTVAIWTVGEMISAPVGYAYVADIAPEHMRGRYQGAFGLAWGTGSVTGPAIGGLLFAMDPATLWLACGALSLCASVLVLAGREALPAPAGAGVPAAMEVSPTGLKPG